MYITTCKTCSDIFEVSDEKVERGICYNCTLKELCGDRTPEEGDFNSAMIISGDMSEQQWKLLKADLESVESGRSIYESCREEDDEEVYLNYLLRKYEGRGM
ncbi:MAG: hypothetical protein Q8P17_05050 [bacterium]|nr:hypothetical protein [bacterium]